MCQQAGAINKKNALRALFLLITVSGPGANEVRPCKEMSVY